MLQPGKYLPLLVAVEFGRGSGVRDGIQSLLASLPSGRDPAAHTALADTEHASYLGVRRSLGDGLDGALAAPFQFLGTSVWSHAHDQTKSGSCGKIKPIDRFVGIRTLAA